MWGKDAGPPPDPYSPEIVEQRREAVAEADSAIREAVALLLGDVVGRASSDECYEGQRNYKVDDGYAHRCTIRRVAAIAFDGDFRERIAQFDRGLFRAGWGCLSSPCHETLAGMVDEYWDMRSAEVGGGAFPISRLPSTGYTRGDLHFDVDYIAADRASAFSLENSHRRQRGGLHTSYKVARPLDVPRVLARAAKVYVVLVAIERDYFEVG